jgi:hypothetical protein
MAGGRHVCGPKPTSPQVRPFFSPARRIYHAGVLVTIGLPHPWLGRPANVGLVSDFCASNVRFRHQLSSDSPSREHPCLACISHTLSTAARDKAASTSLRSFTVLSAANPRTMPIFALSSGCVECIPGRYEIGHEQLLRFFPLLRRSFEPWSRSGIKRETYHYPLRTQQIEEALRHKRMIAGAGGSSGSSVAFVTLAVQKR